VHRRRGGEQLKYRVWSQLGHTKVDLAEAAPGGDVRDVVTLRIPSLSPPSVAREGMYFYILSSETGQTENWRLPERAGFYASLVSDRYSAPKRPSRSEDEWHALACGAVLTLLERAHAVTIVEMEARLSDTIYDPIVCPDRINPHHLTTARHTLLDEGTIEPFSAVAKSRDEQGNPDYVTTWSLPRVRGRTTIIDRTAERKRALTSRWLSWGRRHLLGEAGEAALAAALSECDALPYATGSTSTVLDVPTGELDNSAIFVAQSGGRLEPIQVVFEVKNTREYYYAGDQEVEEFLTKAAQIQVARPDQRILPVFICRRWQWTLYHDGRQHGYLPAMVTQQVVKKDPDLSTDEWQVKFREVQVELFPDLVALSAERRTTNRHRGVVNKLIPREALARSALWAENFRRYLP
jgi:hypothetical protein